MWGKYLEGNLSRERQEVAEYQDISQRFFKKMEDMKLGELGGSGSGKSWERSM